MNKQHVVPGRTGRKNRQARVGQQTGTQTWNDETKEWNHK